MPLHQIDFLTQCFQLKCICIREWIYKLFQEEDEIEYTEEEEAIKTNLETEEPLSNEVMDNILQQWWHKEPFK